MRYLILLAFSLNFAIACSSQQNSDIASVRPENSEFFVKIYKGEQKSQNPASFTGTLVLRNMFGNNQDAIGMCNIIQLPTKVEVAGCYWQNGTDNIYFNTFLSEVYNSGFMSIDGRGHSGESWSCDKENGSDGLIATCKKSQYNFDQDISVNFTFSGRSLWAEVSGYARGRESSIECKDQKVLGREISGTYYYYTCDGSSGNGEPESRYKIEVLRHIESGSDGGTYMKILYTGSGGVTSTVLRCQPENELKPMPIKCNNRF